MLVKYCGVHIVCLVFTLMLSKIVSISILFLMHIRSYMCLNLCTVCENKYRNNKYKIKNSQSKLIDA